MDAQIATAFSVTNVDASVIVLTLSTKMFVYVVPVSSFGRIMTRAGKAGNRLNPRRDKKLCQYGRPDCDRYNIYSQGLTLNLEAFGREKSTGIFPRASRLHARVSRRGASRARVRRPRCGRDARARDIPSPRIRALIRAQWVKRKRVHGIKHLTGWESKSFRRIGVVDDLCGSIGR